MRYNSNIRAPALASAIATAMAIIEGLYSKAAELDYIGENISQLEHAIQCGDLAIGAHASPETVLAAFLHDIGHLISDGDSQKMMNLGRMDHETVGAEFLKNLGFSVRIAELVKLHVTAKRYLVTKHESYAERLSAASKKTLLIQGGKLNISEVEEFEQNPLFKDALRIRSWDEEAKVVGRQDARLSYYIDLVAKGFT
ncbi:MAG: HD domain-containing protein [Pseudomonadota bacterium]|nr:HD domain-containing protein [Pseudomonadota bacterium]